MDLILFRKILAENSQLFKIKLQEIGEPFFCPDIFDMINYAVKKKVLVEIITNGRLFAEKNIQKIVGLCLTKPMVSMDGATNMDYQEFRKRLRDNYIPLFYRNCYWEFRGR